MNKFSRICILALFVLTGPVPSSAQWVPTRGPMTGEVTTLAASGTAMLAGFYRLLFRSIDGGQSWKEVSTPFPEGITSALAYSDSVFYAGGWDGTVYQSTDDGASWTLIASGLSETCISAIAVSGKDIFVGTGFNGHGGECFRLTRKDTGWTATPLPSTGYNIAITTLLISGSRLYRGAENGLFWIDIVGGTAWTEILGSLADQWGHGDNISSLAQFGTALYASTAYNGVFCSTDNGATWQADNNGWPLKGGTYIKTSLVVSGTDLFFGSVKGIYRASMGDTVWTPVNHGLTDLWVSSLTVSGGNLIAGTLNGGLYLSTDQGANWIQIYPGWKFSDISSIANFGPDLFVGAVEGTYLSTADGTNWSRLTLDWPRYGGPCLVYAFARSGSKTFAATKSGVLLSPDNGRSWVTANRGVWPYAAVYSLAISGDDMYAGTSFGVLHSTVSDTTWSLYKNGMPSEAQVNVIAVCGTTLYGGVGKYDSFGKIKGFGVYRTRPTDSIWVPLNDGLTNLWVTSLVVQGTNIFAGTDGGLFRLSDGDTSWTALKLPASSQGISSLIASGAFLYAACGGHIFQSADNGATWTDVTANLPWGARLAISDSYLFVQTSQGVWRRPLSEITAVEKTITQKPADYSLEQNYPNPFNPSTTISFSLPSKEFVTVKIFDVMGREVSTLVNEALPAGTHSRPWNASGVPSGMYFYRLQAGAYTETKRLVILK